MNLPPAKAFRSKRSPWLYRTLIILGVIALGTAVACGVWIWSHASLNGEATDITSYQAAERQNETEGQSQSHAVREPSSLSIPTLSINNASIIPIGIKQDGELEAPGTIDDVGWYQKSSRVGEEGAILLDGHVGIGGEAAVFRDLHRLKTGDEITITQASGETATYLVYIVEQLPIEHVDMRKMLQPVNPQRPGLNIITCGGEYDTARKTYEDRVLVYAALK